MDGGVFRLPPEGDWPAADLEFLNRCPVCGSADRAVAYEGLRDKVFFCAPGVWTMWRCGGCDVGYLDPRPTVESIGRAYETYYTHDKTPPGVVPDGGLLNRLRRIVAHSYLNKRFGYRLRPALPLAWLALAMRPARALSTAHYYRHLPAPRAGDDFLLDVGCGNGVFLQTARDDLGYEVEGLEIDPRARDVATRRGLKIHSGLMPGSGLTPARYYQVTLSHVLEHMHDPVAALQEVFGLLKAGGRVWIAVPNIAAASLSRFGNNSRLLEPPRHLVMFDEGSLAKLLERVGFSDIRLIRNAGGDDFVFDQSWKIENGLDPGATPDSVVPADERGSVMSNTIAAAGDVSSASVIVMTGSKAEWTR
jgi:2-polyprenyl-3-methyl-5-hydroxy-6-metoxy-1,4-benzoquinol methylase